MGTNRRNAEILNLILKDVRTAVVLAGGAGERLRPLTNDRPKPMIELSGKPILHWIIEWLKRNGIRRIVLGVAYCKDVVTDYFGDGSKFGIDIVYSQHSVVGETGEGFRLAIERYVNDDIFIAMNGDELTNFSIKKFTDYHIRTDPVATIAITNPRSPFGIVDADKEGLVLSFHEKPILSSLWVSIGVYLFNREILNYLPNNGSIEKQTFPKLVKNKLLRAYEVDGSWLTINTIKDLKYVENVFSKLVGDQKW